MLVRDIFQKNVVTIRSDDTISEALNLMEHHNIHQLPVMKQEKLSGMVTLKNIISREIPLNTKVGTIVIKTAIINPKDDVREATKILINSGMKSLPVADTKLRGMLSETDIVKTLDKEVDIKSIMTPCVIITEDDNIGKARKIINEKNISRLPVVNEEKIVTGMLRDIDFIKVMRSEKKNRLYSEKMPTDSLTVKTIMGSPITVEEMQAVRNMTPLMQNYGEVIITTDKKPVGIVTAKDILELMVSPEKEAVFVQITGIREESKITRIKIDDIITRFVQKFGKIFDKLDYLFLHVEKHHAGGKRTKYSVRTRFKTPVGMFVSKDYSWDLITSTEKALGKLEKEVKTRYEKISERHKIY